VNKIWDGPRDANGNREWYGLERGASFSGLAGTNPFSIANDHFKYWIHQNTSFDWHTVTETSFTADMLTSIAKFNDVIGTDDDLKAFRKAGGKMITYHGLSDQLIPPRGTYHYYRSSTPKRCSRRSSTGSRTASSPITSSHRRPALHAHARSASTRTCRPTTAAAARTIRRTSAAKSERKTS